MEAPLIGNFANAPSCQGTNPFQTVAYSGTATGGAGPYTYDWDLDGNGTFEILNQRTPTRLYTGSTSVSVTMRVTDSGNPVKTDLQTFSIVPGACVVLPVNLTRFEVSEKDRKAVLTWETTQEKDNAYFLVEYSLDGKSFEALGRVEGHTTTESTHRYAYVHETPPVGTTYYRLRQTDLDGQFTYSKIKSVSIRANGKMAIQPNPVRDFLILSGLEKGAAVYVTNLNGLTLYQTVAETGSLKWSVPKTWENGLYLLQVADRYGRQTFRFLLER
ncbi:PKD domain-containing protein [Larkinella humicola]|uniref:PKD domain-containing protein n=1 Tax=Larkinella humicola TaxID=2607654 RepID=UPI001785B03F|nr:PKD domain-containing protein [Larkinella humicola]